MQQSHSERCRDRRTLQLNENQSLILDEALHQSGLWFLSNNMKEVEADIVKALPLLKFDIIIDSRYFKNQCELLISIYSKDSFLKKKNCYGKDDFIWP